MTGDRHVRRGGRRSRDRTAWSRPTCSPTPAGAWWCWRRTEHPGGAVRSADDHPAPGFTADLFSAFYPLAAASPVVQGMRLEEHGLRWVHAPAVLAHVLDDGRGVLLSRDLDETAASVDEFAPGDGDAWRRWVERWREVERPVLDALLHPFPPVRPALSMARRLGVARALRLARTSVLPARRFVGEEFRGEGAALLLAGNAMHTDLAPEAAGSALYGLLLAMLGQEHGFPVPQGGVRAADRRARRPAAGPRRRAALLGTGDVGRARRVRGRGRRARVRRAGPGPPRGARRRTCAAPLPLDGRHRAPVRPAAARPGPLPVGQRHRQGRTGRCPGRSRGAATRRRRRRDRAPRWRPRRPDPAAAPTSRPAPCPSGRSCCSAR